MAKTHQKLDLKILEIDSMTNFEYEAHAVTGNGSYVNLLKLAWKNSLNHIKLTYFWMV